MNISTYLHSREDCGCAGSSSQVDKCHRCVQPHGPYTHTTDHQCTHHSRPVGSLAPPWHQLGHNYTPYTERETYRHVQSVLCEFQLLQMQIKSINHQLKRYVNNKLKYSHAIRYCAVALLKARTTYTVHGATETYKNYTNQNITSFSHRYSTN